MHQLETYVVNYVHLFLSTLAPGSGDTSCISISLMTSSRFQAVNLTGFALQINGVAKIQHLGRV